MLMRTPKRLVTESVRSHSRPKSKETKSTGVGFVHISYHSRDFNYGEDEFRLAIGFDAKEVDDTNHDEEDGHPCSVQSDIVNLDLFLRRQIYSDL